MVRPTGSLGRWLPKATSAALLAAFCATAAHAADKIVLPGIKGHDDRIIVEPTAFPWSAIGRVNRSVGGFCSGTLVAPDVVLTAAHCLWNSRTGTWLPASSLHFVAGYQRGEYLAHGRVASYVKGDGFDPKAGANLRNAPHDWAVLRLQAPLDPAVGTIPVLPVDAEGLVSSAAGGGTVVHAGYSVDKAHILSVHKGCRFVKEASSGGRLALHDCDATMGDSGSPILLFHATGPRVVAIHVATQRGAEGFGLAVAASVFAAAVRQARGE